MAVLDTTLCGVKIPKGLDVTVSVLSLHYDTKYWENPHKFDPERFSPENKDRIHPFTFLPFGGGPRNCIGMRLALMETKMAIAALLQNYRILTSSETECVEKWVVNILQLLATPGDMQMSIDTSGFRQRFLDD